MQNGRTLTQNDSNQPRSNWKRPVLSTVGRSKPRSARLLSDEFAPGPPRRTVSAGGVRRRLDNRLKRYIVWAALEDMSRGAIADDIGVSKSTVNAFLDKFSRETASAADIGLVVEQPKRGDPADSEWLCRICGRTLQEPGPAAFHATEHLVPDLYEKLFGWQPGRTPGLRSAPRPPVARPRR